MIKRIVAELVGTFVLVFFAVGSAVFGFDAIGPLGVAFAFGLVLLALAYAIGPISGCHVNPAVTLGVLLAGGIRAAEAALYVVAQVVGAILGAALITALTGFGRVVDQTGGLGTNTWGEHISGPGAFVLEVVLTALLVLVVLLVTARQATPGFAGLAIGLTLTVVHLVGIPLDSTSVNPARSIGPALFQGGQALSQLWLFIVAPLVGAVVAYALEAVLRDRTPVTRPDSELEDTDNDPTSAASGRKESRSSAAAPTAPVPSAAPVPAATSVTSATSG
jgi:aquaporin Z